MGRPLGLVAFVVAGCAPVVAGSPMPQAPPRMSAPVLGEAPASAPMVAAPVIAAPDIPAPAEATPEETAPRRRVSDGPTEEEHLTRPEKQWRWIRQATDDTCRERLAETEARFHPVPDRAEPNGHGCGIPRAVALMRGPTGVRYRPAIRVDCSFALRLGEIEGLLHEEASERFGARVTSIGTIGSYACRPVKGRLKGWSGGISEHSFGNALDITHVDLANGRRVSVARDYPRNRAPAERPGGKFLRAVVARVWDETGMRALSPDFDKSHLGHLHFDAGSRWWRWRPSGG